MSIHLLQTPHLGFCVALIACISILACTSTPTSPNAKRTTITNSSIGPAQGFNADRPCFVSEHNGAYSQPWGAAGFSWPQMLFWQGNAELAAKYNDMIGAADGTESDGRAPLLGTVAWGFDLTAATGGGNGIEDRSTWDGYKQYAAWFEPRKQDYWALNDSGTIAYPGQGYVSFMMPMKHEDLDSGMDTNATFGDWAGKRLGLLANYIHCRGAYAADFFIGVAFGTDYHPRILQSFEQWTAQIGKPVVLPNTDIPGKVAYISQNSPSLWYDFKSLKHSTFFAAIGKVLLDSGKVPMVGGQISSDPALGRYWGNDLRLMAQTLPAKYWSFMVEVESAGDRDTPPEWTGAMSIGSNASLAPDISIGIMLDAQISDFWNANARAGHDKNWGLKYLKHVWLSSNWTHVANTDGSVRRAAQADMRSFWDAGTVDSLVWQTILAHIPRHPFGPALYYSYAIEKSFEAPPPPNTDTPNYYYLLVKLTRDLGVSQPITTRPLVMQGVNIGYWVSDTAVSNLTAANKPTAWIVYESSRLPSNERNALEAIAPVIDPEQNPAMLDSIGPVRVKGLGLNCLAFIDQNGSAVVMITNNSASSSKGTVLFNHVENGSFIANGLIGTADQKLAIQKNVGQFSISVPGRETFVYEMPGLKWVGH